MPEINVPLMRKVLEHITAHPDEHDQNDWARMTECGTTLCMAGHTAVIAGWTPNFCDGIEITSRFRMGADSRHVVTIAADALGLDNRQASRMFMSAYTLDELWSLAEEFTGGEIVAPVGGSEPAGSHQ